MRFFYGELSISLQRKVIGSFLSVTFRLLNLRYAQKPINRSHLKNSSMVISNTSQILCITSSITRSSLPLITIATAVGDASAFFTTISGVRFRSPHKSKIRYLIASVNFIIITRKLFLNHNISFAFFQCSIDYFLRLAIIRVISIGESPHYFQRGWPVGFYRPSSFSFVVSEGNPIALRYRSWLPAHPFP